jgi:hypothetical protein
LGRRGRVVVREGRCIPIKAQLNELSAHRPQVRDVDGSPGFFGGHHQARTVGTKVRPLHFAEVGAFESRERAAGLGLDRPKNVARVLYDHQAAVRGKAASLAADLPRLAPGADGPEPAWRRVSHQPRSGRAEVDAGYSIGRQLGDLPASAIRQIRAPPL